MDKSSVERGWISGYYRDNDTGNSVFVQTKPVGEGRLVQIISLELDH